VGEEEIADKDLKKDALLLRKTLEKEGIEY